MEEIINLYPNGRFNYQYCIICYKWMIINICRHKILVTMEIKIEGCVVAI